ncbi:MAG: cytochrome c [Burkholderiales bacterium]|nr:cytochrome c [Burkholderiales bacterium]
MRISKRGSFGLTLLLAISAGFMLEPAFAADAGATRHLVQTLCQNCHGMDGVSVLPGAPNLSGQQKEYLIQQLRAYRAGSRQDAQMNVVAKGLSDADIEHLADWYSSIKVSVEMPK